MCGSSAGVYDIHDSTWLSLQVEENQVRRRTDRWTAGCVDIGAHKTQHVHRICFMIDITLPAAHMCTHTHMHAHTMQSTGVHQASKIPEMLLCAAAASKLWEPASEPISHCYKTS